MLISHYAISNFAVIKDDIMAINFLGNNSVFQVFIRAIFFLYDEGLLL